jgi:hypothetical protein
VKSFSSHADVAALRRLLLQQARLPECQEWLEPLEPALQELALAPLPQETVSPRPESLHQEPKLLSQEPRLQEPLILAVRLM